jgi:DNA-binding MarR family transcriptional regulator
MARENSLQSRELAGEIHSVAIHLLRKLRREDSQTGLNAPRLSALSVIVFAGPLALGDLAATEQVRPPTMTRIVDALAELGMVEKRRSPHDGRSTIIGATPRGKSLLRAGRKRRVYALARQIAVLDPSERERLVEAVGILSRVVAAI